ncbi:MAG: EsaB/YukD family protein [Tannerellaceae bacterium]|jgi:hypothetical protein|nr:EsaB/YukD family protein [Tannerellaceae bacterium]
MANINVRFIHPTDSSEVEVEMDENTTADKAINSLIAENFMPDNPNGGYTLQVKGGSEVRGGQTLVSGGAANGSVIRVIAATDAGN